jgi:hypothetical protein
MFDFAVSGADYLVSVAVYCQFVAQIDDSCTSSSGVQSRATGALEVVLLFGTLFLALGFHVVDIEPDSSDFAETN